MTMTTRGEFSTNKLTSGALVGAVTAGLVAASLSLPAPANAWCVGLSGLNLGNGCTSTLGNFSIGLGENAQAHSDGFITGAIAFGNDTTANSQGLVTAAWAGGTDSTASANGIVAWAVTQGDQADAVAGALGNDIGNVAINFGGIGLVPGSNKVTAAGTANLAANVFGNGSLNNASDVQALGILNNAINLGGNQSAVSAGSASGGRATFSSASNFLGTNNVVTAGPGPGAVASAFGGSGRTVDQSGPGITINDFLDGDLGATSSTSVLATSSPGSLAKNGLGLGPTVANADSDVSASLSKATAPGVSALKTISDRIAAARQRSLVRNSLGFSPAAPNAVSDVSANLSKATAPGVSALKTISDPITKSAKKLRRAVSKVTSKPDSSTAADTDSNSTE